MIDLIINPTAGNGRAVKIGDTIKKILEQRGIPFRAHTTRYSFHAAALAKQAAEDGSVTVIIVGGDGTAYEAACGLMNTETALGIIPAGTGNDFIKSIGYPKNPIKALDHILSHKPTHVDTGLINDHMFLNCCGVGFDVKVLEYALKAKKHVRGLLPYLYGVVRTIFTYEPIQITYELETGETVNESVLLFSIANGRYIGGGIPIAPLSSVDDGLFDIITVKAIPKWKIPFYLPGLMMGRINEYKIERDFRCSKIKLHTVSGDMNVDGDILHINDAEFTISKTALKIHR